MAVDEEAAAILQRALGAGLAIRETRMFGGIAFMLGGHMLCGALSRSMGGGALFRVGAEREAEALAIDGTGPFAATGRRMRGFVTVPTEVLEDDAALDRLLGLALAHVDTLPPKRRPSEADRTGR